MVSMDKSFYAEREKFLGVKIPQNLMDLKEIITTQGPYIKHTIGDGPDTFLWLDNWQPVGSILKAKGEKLMYTAALALHFRVSYIFVGNRWRRPCTESLELMKLQRDQSEQICPRQGVKDEVAWTLNQKSLSLSNLYGIRLEVTEWTGTVYFGFPNMFLGLVLFFD